MFRHAVFFSSWSGCPLASENQEEERQRLSLCLCLQMLSHLLGAQLDNARMFCLGLSFPLGEAGKNMQRKQKLFALSLGTLVKSF